MRFCEANFLDAHAALVAEFHEWAGLRSEADSDTSDVCILPPDQIVAQANAAEEKLKILNSAYKTGPDALGGMGLQELRSLCKLHGISPKRTKAEMVNILNSAKPGTDWESVSYQGVVDAMAGVQSITYTKPELIKKLSDKWLREKIEAENPVPSLGLGGLSIEELRELAKQQGISVNITKQDVIDSLNIANPNVDHAELPGVELAKKQKELFGASKKKDKVLLMQALEKAAQKKAIKATKIQEKVISKLDRDYILSNDDDYIKSVDASLRESLDWYKRNGYTNESITFIEYSERVQNGLRGLLAKNDTVYSRTDAAGLSGILDSGRFRTQYETGQTKGLIDWHGTRKTAERKMFGILDNSDPTERPIYGYMHPKDSAGANDKEKLLDTYGKVAVKFKGDIKKRTTFSYNDSLPFGNRNLGCPSSIENPQARSLEWGWVKPDNLENMPYPGQYIEAQIHAGVSVNDIESVTFLSDGKETKEMIDEREGLISRLKEKKIPYMIEIAES